MIRVRHWAALARRFGISLSGLTTVRDRIEQTVRHDKTLMETSRRLERKRMTL